MPPGAANAAQAEKANMGKPESSSQWQLRKGWSVLALTAGLALTCGVAIADSGWTSGLSLIPAATLGALVVGLMLALSRLPAGVSHLFSLVIGFAWSFRLAATLFPTPYSWPYRWAWLWWRLSRWTVKLVTGGTSADNLVFVLYMAFLSWLAVYLMVWFIIRSRKVWFGIVATGSLLLANSYYAPNNLTIYLLVYLILALMLVIRFNLLNQEMAWKKGHVHFNAGEVVFGFMRAGLLFALFILLLTWLIPTAVVAERNFVTGAVRAPWYDLQSEWNRLFSSLNYQRTPSPDFSGRSLGLGGPRHLADTPVLEVEAPPGLRYWRTVAFDTFNGRGWENSDTTTVRFGADFPNLPVVSYQARTPISHTVTVLIPDTSALAMAGHPSWVSRSARARLSYLTNIRNETSEVDAGALLVDTISFAQSRIPLVPGDRYLVSTAISEASIQELRLAGDDYPSWAIARYQQIPDDLPQRVRQLAQDITTDSLTAYDKATAIESYLRREITYNENIPAPPPNQNPVDYLLFESKQGYCDYYATAMAVMLRSLGIPARVASGYAQGEYNDETKTFLVRQKHAHSWVEVFFPGYGWIEFEPTAAQVPIARKSGPDDDQDSAKDQASPSSSSGIQKRPNQMDRVEGQDLGDAEAGSLPDSRSISLLELIQRPWIPLSLLVLLAVMVAVWYMRRRQTGSLTEIETVYDNMLRLAALAGVPLHDWQTPNEQARAIGAVLPDGGSLVSCIARLYARERYAGRPFTAREQAELGSCWSNLRPKLRRAIWQQRVVKRLRAAVENVL